MQPPRAPSDHLRFQSLRTYSRLRLIIEFRPWLDGTALHLHRPSTAPLPILWHCFSYGVSLIALLNLLGSPFPGETTISIENFDFNIPIDAREAYFDRFLQQIQFLETQGHLPYGEVLRIDDLFGGTNSGFMRVLRTVERILVSLQDSYPGLFFLPHSLLSDRPDKLRALLESEEVHVARLQLATYAIEQLSAKMVVLEPCLESFAISAAHLLQYHQDLLKLLTHDSSEPWDFFFPDEFCQDETIQSKVFAAYRSLSAHHLACMALMEAISPQSDVAHFAQILVANFSEITSRMACYSSLLQEILDATLPTDDESYDLLCFVALKIKDMSEIIDEIGSQIRTMRAVSMLKARAYHWNRVNPEDCGALLLDDRVVVDPDTGLQFSIFIFETHMLCCCEVECGDVVEHENQSQYPIRPWGIGPALRRDTALNIVHAIPKGSFGYAYSIGTGALEIEWFGDSGDSCYLQLYDMNLPQYEQWLAVLTMFVPHILDAPFIPTMTLEDHDLLSDEEVAGGRRRTRPRPWSVIGRKGPRSESSSMIYQLLDERLEYEAVLTPGLLPTLFDSPSPPDSPLTPSMTSLGDSDDPDPPSYVFDLDGSLEDLSDSITRSPYPSAHGGFADVYQGIWHSGHKDIKVAVKVPRTQHHNSDRENMRERLKKELRVWKSLSHPHLLELYGISMVNGCLNAMVCPWMENGTVNNYMDKYGDILSMGDRLRLSCEVADGLAYLHKSSIVHGDLSGPNILINNQGKACLCDFGLSSVVAELQDGGHPKSTLGGSIRWADCQLYRPQEEDGAGGYTLTTRSDIYSFGSVVLELLSGRIPYHYIHVDALVVIELHKGNKPRRPARTFVTDLQWAFIQRCWADDANERPTASEAHRLVQNLYHMSLEELETTDLVIRIQSR
ncbi:kinase-like domain-containing protein [Infundibulicybe gibba]|nr:kinase-like domain-containing protein [Infundibulicybe gibba]